MTEGTRKAILYARISTKGQADDGYSLRQQLEALRGWTEAEGYEILVRRLGVEPRASGRSTADA